VYVSAVKLDALKKAPVLIAAGVIGVVCLLQLLHLELFEEPEKMTYDWRVRQAASHSPLIADNLGFVNINDETIDRLNDNTLGFRYGLYWPRHIYGRVARELSVEGAKAVAFDVLFAGLRPDHTTVLMADETTLNSDEYLAQQMRRAGSVIIAARSGLVPLMPHALFRTNAFALGDITTDRDSDGILRRAKAFRTYRKWHRAFQQLEDDPDYGVDLGRAIIKMNEIKLIRSEGLEAITIPLDGAGNFDMDKFVGTNLPPGMARFAKPYTENRVWHMGLVLAAKSLGMDLEQAKVDLPNGRITLRGVNGLERVIPVDADGYFYINWCLKPNDPRLTTDSFEAVLARDQMRLLGETNKLSRYARGAPDWHGKLAVIGSTATGNDLTDRGATPLENDTILMSGHWNVANSLLTGQFVTRSPAPVNLLLIGGMGVLAAYLTWRIRSYFATLAIIGVFAAYVLGAFWVYVKFRYWVPVVLPLGGGLLAMHVMLLLHVVIFEQAERRRVRSVFSKVVSPEVFNELLNRDVDFLSGARRNVTVLFSDIRGFTEMTDVNRELAAEYIKEHNLVGHAAESIFDRQARDALDTVNRYLKVIADTVMKHHGTIDKFIGDCVMAFWGAPTPNDKHALACVQAAIDAQRAIHKMNRERQNENLWREAENLKLAAAGKPLWPMLPVLMVGTGINTGVVTVGYMGSDERRNYTVFGRDVNLANRLETESGRGRIIISEATLAEIIQDDPALALSCVALPPKPFKGIKKPVLIYEVPWREGSDDQPETPPAVSEDNTGYFARLE
jgi:class 3 adenylate cyclase